RISVVAGVKLNGWGGKAPFGPARDNCQVRVDSPVLERLGAHRLGRDVQVHAVISRVERPHFRACPIGPPGEVAATLVVGRFVDDDRLDLSVADLEGLAFGGAGMPPDLAGLPRGAAKLGGDLRRPRAESWIRAGGSAPDAG